MKQNYILIIFLVFSIFSFSQNVFISEIHTDTGVEVTGPSGEKLKDYSIQVYKSNFWGLYSVGSTKLTGKLGPGSDTYYSKNFEINNLELSWWDWGRIIVLKNNKGSVDAVSYGYFGALQYEDVTYIGEEPNATDGTSAQLIEDVWIQTNKATPGEVNSAKSLSVVKNNIEGFKMYPNPVSNGELNIASNNWSDKEVEIYNMNGQQMYNKLLKNNEVLDIHNLNKGIYLVRIIEDDKIATRKLIVN